MSCALLLILLLWFLADAAQVRGAMQDALSLCAKSVVPAMFPFMVVSSLLLSLGLGELLSPWLAGFMEPLFRIPGAGSSALVLGLIGGYPIGAKTAADLYRQGLLTRQEAERLLRFSNNSNPVFLISVLGSGVFGSVRVGVWIWLIHVATAVLTGLLLCRMGQTGSSQPPARNFPFRPVRFTTAFVEAVRSSLQGILSVCAFVVFFYVAARPLSALGGTLGPVLVGVTELFSLTPLLPDSPFGLVVAAGAAGWGGVSVLCQTAAVLDGSGLRIRPCLVGKAVHGLLSAGLAALLAGYILS